MDKSRRNFLRNTSLLALTSLGTPLFSGNLKGAVFSDAGSAKTEEFLLPKLPYAYDALEPHIDKQTMEIHHTKHHQAYVNSLNKAVSEGGITASFDDLIKKASTFPPAVRNNGGGHWNHSFFWKLMKSSGGGLPTGKIGQMINESFNSFEEFKKALEDAGLKRFGSGWAWLVIDSNKKLVIGSTPNQDNPLMDVSDFKGKPLLGVDVWEHAYYLKYQNKRGDYLKAWWNVINWDEVNKNLEEALKG